MDPLAEIHLALREAGWEPTYFGSDTWAWTAPERRIAILTVRSYHDEPEQEFRPAWFEYRSRKDLEYEADPTHSGFTADELRQRLQELTPQK